MTLCRNCDTTYSALSLDCPWCDRRREELLERLQVDGEAVGLEVVSGWALHGRAETPQRCWEVQ